MTILLVSASCQSLGQVYIVDGYTDKQSYRAGDEVTFHLNGVAFDGLLSHVPVLTSDSTATGELVDGLGFLHTQSSQSEGWVNGYGYDATATWTVPSSLKSGYYFLAAHDGNANRVSFIVKAPDPSTADIVVVIPTNTISAYSHLDPSYDFYDIAAPTLSFHRPQSRFNYGEFDNGLLEWLVTSGMIDNYNISFISDMDLDNWSEIASAKLLIIPGHSEYWSRQARVYFDRFVDLGGNALILSGNTMWVQVRYEDENGEPDATKLTCYKQAGDPDLTYPLLETINWNEPTLKYSILGSTGTDYLRGGYGITGGNDGDPCYGGFMGHKIMRPGSPLLAGTGLSYHEILHFQTQEYDGTLVRTDANGNAVDASGNVIVDPENVDPVLDVQALGFFRAELIGYDIITPPSIQIGPTPTLVTIMWSSTARSWSFNAHARPGPS